MYIKNIKLENYRNYHSAYIEFDRGVNIVLGDNAQGKTNLLESIYVLSMGKSFRTSKDRELIKFNSEFSRIRAEYVKDDYDLFMEIAYGSNGRKAVNLDGENLKKISKLMDNIITVIFSPEDLSIIKDEPSKRRNFIDRELSQLKPIYFNYLSKYKRVLTNKNKYLKEKNIRRNVVDVFNEQLVEYGSKIIEYRIDFIDRLEKISREIHRDITNKKEEIKVIYKSDVQIDYEYLYSEKYNCDIGNKDILSKKINEKYYEILKETIDEDIMRRSSTRGPHKDDLAVLINGIDARKFGSQGQQRTASLSLKLAEIQLIREEKNENPILLLDDVMSELDYERQRYLVNSIKDIQIFLTTTDINKRVMDNLPKGKTIYVNNGLVK